MHRFNDDVVVCDLPDKKVDPNYILYKTTTVNAIDFVFTSTVCF